jgi:hypothetical protein
MLCPGLPQIGDTWAIFGDLDLLAFCHPDLKVTPEVTGEANTLWQAEQTFSTRAIKRCQSTSVDDPLLEPPEVSGTFTKYIREAYVDKDGDAITNSSLEIIRGELVEYDDPRPTVQVGMNVSTLPLATVTQILRQAPLNSSTMWGLPARSVKLSNFTFTRKYYESCSVYYHIVYDFEINFDTWDRWMLDHGTRRLRDSGDDENPDDMIQHRNGNDGSLQTVLLDGSGGLLAPGGTPVEIKIELFDESNLLLLGIPSSL